MKRVSLFVTFASLVLSHIALAAPPREVWRPAQINVIVKSSVEKQTHAAVVQREVHWTEIVPYTAYRTEMRDELVPSTCYEVVCRGQAGQSALWDAFYAASRKDKPRRLADAIKGVGPASAKALVEAEVFRTKPRTWAEFAALIREAGDRRIISRSVATQVVETYREDNLRLLGYSPTSCRSRAYSCDLWIEREYQVPYIAYREEARSEVRETLHRSLEIEVQGARLLPHEADRLVVTIGPNDAITVDQSAAANRYRIQYTAVGNGVISVLATQESRAKVNYPPEALKNASLRVDGNEASLVVDMNPDFLPDNNDPHSRLTVSFSVMTCEYGWTGYCSIFGRWTESQTDRVAVSEARTLIPVKIPLHHRGYVRFSIARENSEFYNDASLAPKDTSVVNMPAQ